MAMSSKLRRILFWLLVFGIFFLSFLGFVLAQLTLKKHTIGYEVVKLMYTFNDVYEIEGNYDKLRTIISESCLKNLDIDSEFRAINSYYKFDAKPSSVIVVYEKEGFLIYKLKNDAIPITSLWCFEYEIVNHKVDNIREYQLVDVFSGKEGVFR